MGRRVNEKTRNDEELGKAAMAHQQQQLRRKGGLGFREWVVVMESCGSHTEEVGKHTIMRRTGLPARDLRILDPVLSYPSTILGRERAIVINLEHIKAIVTAKELFMIRSTNPLVVQFVNDLQDRVSSPRDRAVQHFQHEEESTTTKTGMVDGQKVLPFEFRALEACLESACKCLESETQTLEQEAYPALDELSSKISTLNLERVRQIKSRLVEISGRVQKVRDELEHLLDDDNDMAEMYLTEKFNNQLMGSLSGRDRGEINNDEIESHGESEGEDKYEQNSEIYTGVKPNVEELEMLLEAYFAQIDGVSQKLSHMSEYVNDTEDFINIMLDDKQNQLLQMGVMLSTGNMILNAGIVVVGLFGMNIEISLFSATPKQFWETTLGTIGGCIAFYLIAIGWGRTKRLL